MPDHRPARPVADRLLVAAVALAAVLHGSLLAAGSYRRTYDAYIHIFFADHYARGWFSTWEPRWYTGFTTTSYPPGTHQLIALLSRVVGLEWGFVLVQLGAVLLLVVGVHRFSRLWVPPRAAGWAAVLTALSSSVAEVVHTFGQLPTTLSLAFLLNATPHVHRWVARGGLRHLASATACLAATTAAHHVTTLFGSVFFLGPVVADAVLERFRRPLPDEATPHPARLQRSNLAPLVARRVRRIAGPLSRSALLGLVAGVTLLTVVLPYWLWSSRDPITQIPIPHASRADFLADHNAGLVFWVVPWGVLLVTLPLLLLRGLLGRTWPLAASVALLTLLGTGGTTPLPRLILGGAFDILTLDRFTFWATIAVLPLAGWGVESLIHGRAARWVRANLGPWALPAVQVALALALLGSTAFAANLASLRRFQPDRIDPGPITTFLDKDQHSRWRYLTLGFGDQMAWLSANTTATTVDGNYHSARRLPELTSTSVERLEGAKYRGVPGIGSLQQFLAVPARYHLKFVFSNDEFYDPLLTFSGWHRLRTLENGVAVWERADVPPLPTVLPSREVPRWQRLLWGTVPMTSIAAAAAVLGSGSIGLPRPRRAPRRRRDGRAGRTWALLDARLAALAAQVVEDGPGRRRARPLERFRTTVASWAERAPTPRRRRWQAAALGALCLIGTSAAVLPGRGPVGPEAVVEAYYEALDLRHFADAHDLLDPATRPALDQYLLELSVRDGLVASYGTLARVSTELVTMDGDRAQVQARLEYLTSLSTSTETVLADLVRVDGRWSLRPEPVDPTVPPDQLVRRPSIEFLSQGRRRVTTGTTAYADVIDRPEVVTTEARLVRQDGRWVVVGEVRNDDVDPADVTVTAQLLDAEGTVLAQYDAADAMLHDLLPRERTPFRVDFEGIAGALDVTDPSAGPFDPTARTPLTIDEAAVRSFAVYTKAVVTGRGLDRSLVAQDLRLEHDDRGTWLVGTLRNDGTMEVTIPHLLLAYRDEAGGLTWVDQVYLEDAVRPQRRIPLRVLLEHGIGIEVGPQRGARYDNGLGAIDAGVTAPDGLPLTSPSRFASVELHLGGFVREAQL